MKAARQPELCVCMRRRCIRCTSFWKLLTPHKFAEIEEERMVIDLVFVVP